MRFGLIYTAPWLYNFALWFLYRTRPRERFACVADEIEEGDVIVDLCAGTALLYEAIAEKNVQYRAFDVNPRFVKELRARGIEAVCCDIEKTEVPVADVVTMSSALYHFHPRCRPLVERMCASARKKVVLVEPVRNNSSSKSIWGAFARWMSRVDGRDVPFHFNLQSMNDLIDEIDLSPQIRRVICDGRDMFVVLPGTACGDFRMQEDRRCAKTS